MSGVSAREYLAGLEFFGIRLGLENITRLLAALDHPERRYPTIHVAGTNGKGSVVAFTEGILRAAGYRCGRYTSPHLQRVNERILIGSEPVSDERLDSCLARLQEICKDWETPPTYFEFMTAAAFLAFAEEQVDAAVIEVGMGGRYDATNVLIPVATAITPIDWDHMEYLGDTLEAIAGEKAGILKPGIPLVTSETKQAPLNVILERASELDCPVRALDRDFHYALEGGPFDQTLAYQSPSLSLHAPLGLNGAHQGMNAAAAVALAEAVMSVFPRVDADAIQRGLAATRWPCRLERVLDDPPVIVDVAHNPAGLLTLCEAIPRAVFILAPSKDKDAAAMIRLLGPQAEELILSQCSMHRRMPVEVLVEAAGDTPHRRVDSLKDAIAMGLSFAHPQAPLVITGSIFTAGEARAILCDRHGGTALSF